MNLSKQEIESKIDEYFATKPQISFSGMIKLIESPKVFLEEQILKIKEPTTSPNLIRGSLTHFLVLKKDISVSEEFQLSPENLPSEAVQKILYEIYNQYLIDVEEGVANEDTSLEYYSQLIFDTLAEANLYQNLGAKNDTEEEIFHKRVSKILNTEGIEFFNYLKKSKDKILIDAKTFDYCLNAAQDILNNEKARELLAIDREHDPKAFGKYNEIMINREMDYPFDIRGILDNFTIDIEKKVVRINDIKTTGKTIKEFEESVEMWKYWLQAIFYLFLVDKFCRNIIDHTWKIIITFIVRDKLGQVYTFEVSEETKEKWMKDTYKVFETAKWHIGNRSFNLPKDYELGLVKL